MAKNCYTREQIETAVKEKGYKWFDDSNNKGYDVNIVGVRNAETKDRLVAYRLVQRQGSNDCGDNVFSSRWKANRGGSYAVHLYKVDNSSTSSRIYVNDIEVDSSTSDNAWYVINVNLGDIIYFELRTASNSSQFEYMHCYIYTSNPFSDFECLGGTEVKKTRSSGGVTTAIGYPANLGVDIY